MNYELKSKSKILFVSDVTINNVNGGAERVLFEQSTRLARRGHSVHILTRRLPEHEEKQDIVHGVREWRYSLNHDSNSFSYLFNSIIKAKSLFNYLQNKYKFSCINFHQPFSSLGIIYSPLSNTSKKYYTCHSLSYEEFISRNFKHISFINRNLHRMHILGRKWIEKKILNYSDGIIVLSQYTRSKLKKSYNIKSNKVSIVPGGVDLEKFYPCSNRTLIRKSLGIGENKFILFTVRNLVQRMGLENLITALKDVVKEVPDIYLIIGGDGPLKKELTKLSRKYGLSKFIEFVGFIPEEQLPKYYQSADLFVLPTKDLEGFGMVTLEALASGLPVLGTPIGGTKEILEEFEPGFLFKNTDPGSISYLIKNKYLKARKNPQWWQDVSSRCRGFVEARYSWEKNIDSLESILMQ